MQSQATDVVYRDSLVKLAIVVFANQKRLTKDGIPHFGPNGESVKVMRTQFQRIVRESLELSCLHVNHPVVILERAFNKQKLATSHY